MTEKRRAEKLVEELELESKTVRGNLKKAKQILKDIHFEEFWTRLVAKCESGKHYLIAPGQLFDDQKRIGIEFHIKEAWIPYSVCSTDDSSQYPDEYNGTYDVRDEEELEWDGDERLHEEDGKIVISREFYKPKYQWDDIVKGESVHAQEYEGGYMNGKIAVRVLILSRK